MPASTSKTAFRAFLYGAAAMLLIFDLIFFFRAVISTNFIPIIPITAGILTAGGLLLIVYAEQRARLEDKRDHRRISRVAHQLESPLQALQEDLQALLGSAARLPADERLKLKRMETKTKVLLENVRDVFLMLRASEQSLTQELRLYNICTLVEGVLEQQRSLAKARNVELIHHPQCTDATAYVDRALFIIALTHVIENAIVYTLTPGLVNVTVLKENKWLCIVVQDRGIGVAAEDAAVVWQPFARGSQAEQYDADGIGVGLTLSRLIIAEFGGKLEFHPRTTGMGTEFEIALPLSKDR